MAGETGVLSQKQVAFLGFAAEQKTVAENYYLTGGTPLAAFYLQHRYSEDLDFFIEHEEVNLLSIQKIIGQAKEKFHLKNISYEHFQGLHIFFLEYLDREMLKVDFSYYPFPRIEEGQPESGIDIDSLIDIAVNKIQSIGTRTKARDYVDLYFMVKEKGLVIRDLMQLARNKFDFYIDPIQYGKQFLKVTEAKDYPRMIKSFDPQDMERFFLAEAEKLAREILQ